MSLSAPCTTRSQIPGIENYADFVLVFRYFLSSGWERRIDALIKFIRYLFEESLYAFRFDGREGHPIYSRGPIVPFSQRICSA